MIAGRLALIGVALCLIASCAKPDGDDLDQGATLPASDQAKVSASRADLRADAPVAPSLDAATAFAGEINASSLSTLAALSEEEAVWLDRNGYPTPEELADALEADENELVQAMHRGSGRAAALLGHKLVEQGDHRRAAAVFGFGADLGSIYAREQHAITQLAMRSRNHGAFDGSHEEMLFVARMNVAKMLGDHRADVYIEQYGKGLDMSLFGDDVLAQTAEFMRQYGRTKAPRPPDPRPNANLWRELEKAAPAEVITIYRRTPPRP